MRTARASGPTLTPLAGAEAERMEVETETAPVLSDLWNPRQHCPYRFDPRLE